MGKQQKNNKNQKVTSVKKLTSEEKREQERLIEKELKKEKLSAVFEKAVSSRLIILPIAVLCFGIMCGVCYLNEDEIFSSSFTVQGIFHCLYVGDLSIGISSRLLIGSILSLFTDTLTAEIINTFAKAFLFISFALQSLVTAAVIRKGLSEKNIFILLLSVIFVVCPVTVCAYTLYFGVLDMYNYVLFIIAMMIIVKGKSLHQPLVPLISAVGILIHYSFFFAFFPALFVAELYRTVSCNRDKFKVEAVSLGVNSALSTGLFFYLTLFAKNFLFMNSDEMLQYVHSKTDKSVMIFDDYLLYYIYDNFLGTVMPDASSSLSALINKNNELRKPDATVQYLLFTALLFIIFWAVNAVLIKREKGKKKLPFIAACVMPLAIIPELILSSDTWRWVAGTVFSLFLVLFGFYIMNVPSLEKLFSDMKKLRPPVKYVITAVLVIYIALCFVFEHRIYT